MPIILSAYPIYTQTPNVHPMSLGGRNHHTSYFFPLIPLPYKSIEVLLISFIFRASTGRQGGFDIFLLQKKVGEKKVENRNKNTLFFTPRLCNFRLLMALPPDRKITSFRNNNISVYFLLLFLFLGKEVFSWFFGTCVDSWKIIMRVPEFGSVNGTGMFLP